jgi:DNA primase
MERDAVMAMLQLPQDVGVDLLSEAAQSFVANPSLAMIRDAIGANQQNFDQASWIDGVSADVPENLRPLVMQLAVAPLPERGEKEMTIYARAIVVAMVERDVVRRKSDLMSRMQRLDPGAADESREIQRQLIELESKRRKLRDE